MTVAVESPQLNFLDGDDRKAMGLELVEVANAEFLSIMRAQAREVSLKHGQVTIDEVRTFADAQGLVPTSKHVWGAVFNSKGWKCIGYAPSKIPTNHGHQNRVWQWVGE